jgi:NAD(P)-dependent dehydrogenase (short-subunit alcohol dehydrogenase family)
MNVTDKIAIVTGGGRGIGRGISLVLARNGADIVVADLVADNARSVADEVRAMGRKSLALSLDVTSQVSADAMVESVMAEFGRIDILVNNAGIIGAPGWESRETPNDDDWDMVYAVNVKGIAKVTNAVAPHMVQRQYGKIINIASIAGRQGSPRNPPYNVSKTGVISLTQAQALDLAPHHINVNAICPGLLWTPMWERITARESMTPNPEGKSQRQLFEDYVQRMVPMRKEQTPEDIGHLAAFLASDFAHNITGQAINVIGGLLMHEGEAKGKANGLPYCLRLGVRLRVGSTLPRKASFMLC